MRKLTLWFFCCLLSQSLFALAKIDKDVLQEVRLAETQSHPQAQSINGKDRLKIRLLIFLNQTDTLNELITQFSSMNDVFIQQLEGLPFLIISIPKNQSILKKIAKEPAIAQISSYHGGQEELEISKQAMLLKPSSYFPNIKNWIESGYTGASGIVGLIDSGVDINHPGLQGKNIIIRKEPHSGYFDYKNGVRTAHGTGVACIYAGRGSSIYPQDSGIAQEVPTIIEGIAGEGEGNPDDIEQTLSTLDWMLHRATLIPTVINYSFGNGRVYCSSCEDWSGLAKVFDYVVNHYHIPFVKSAGNFGFISQSKLAPYVSTMTVPADNYNGITIANMNPTLRNGSGELAPSPNRLLHTIRYSSSRGPTLAGRKKPDLSAPGNDTWTCAPDPLAYSSIKYTQAMKYINGYRLMGGTSSATPHVGAAILLLEDAGIKSPMAQKALLINSADAWTDNGLPSPDDPKSTGINAHYPVRGSEWNPTYGWGYINLQKAFEERLNLYEGILTLAEPEQIFEADFKAGSKVTLVHERRVGFSGMDSKPWDLSHLSIELIDKSTGLLINKDDSKIDSVHQIDNCLKMKSKDLKKCENLINPVPVIIRVRLLSDHIDGKTKEPFALAISLGAG
ncbi:MAG: S8 family serine peptidase [Tatlockia sp.]|nr:S8 family serine peptidase [Tatlockia sp.]